MLERLTLLVVLAALGACQNIDRTSAETMSVRPLGMAGDWRLILAEEFETLNPDIWSRCYWWDDDGCTNLGNNELQWYRPENVEIAGGRLRLVARPEEVTGFEGRSFGYTSGMVTTGPDYQTSKPKRFSFQYGYVEVVARIPSGQGLWPAIWLLPSDWESRPEIDVMEVLGHRPDVLEMHYHYFEGRDRRSAGHEVEVGDLSRDWHVYGLEWSREAIVWYLDGAEVWRFEERSAIAREPMYLLMTLAVGGDWPGAPDRSTRFPAEFLIESVRVWQRSGRGG
ncbi:MAG: glycoside hydrolase family 16 protein [Bauldia sp.]|nr:glycoside hydrolase family 16 protein [Bauldia sp.]